MTKYNFGESHISDFKIDLVIDVFVDIDSVDIVLYIVILAVNNIVR